MASLAWAEYTCGATLRAESCSLSKTRRSFSVVSRRRQWQSFAPTVCRARWQDVEARASRVFGFARKQRQRKKAIHDGPVVKMPGSVEEEKNGDKGSEDVKVTLDNVEALSVEGQKDASPDQTDDAQGIETKSLLTASTEREPVTSPSQSKPVDSKTDAEVKEKSPVSKIAASASQVPSVGNKAPGELQEKAGNGAVGRKESGKLASTSGKTFHLQSRLQEPSTPSGSSDAAAGFPTKSDGVTIESLLEMIKDAEKNILLLNRVRMRASEEVEQMKTENEVLQGQLKVLEARLKESEAKLKLLTQVTAKNSLLQEQVDVLTKRVTEADLELKRMSQTKQESMQVQQQLNDLKAKLSEAEAKVQEARQLESANRALADQLEDMKFRLMEREEDELKEEAEGQSAEQLLRSLEQEQSAKLRSLEQEQSAKKAAFVNEMSDLQEQRERLEVQVTELESLLEERQAALESEAVIEEDDKEESDDDELQELALLRGQIKILNKEREAEKEVAARAQAEKDILRQQVELLKQRLLESDAEIAAQLEMYQTEVEQFQVSLERLSVNKGEDEVVSVPVGEMPWEFWSNLLLRIDSLMLHKRLTLDQGIALRLMAWHRDARIRDAYEIVELEGDQFVAEALVNLVRVKQRPGMHIVQIAAEMAPVAKVGGLADVVTGLGRALQSKGHLVEFVLPKYDCMDYSRIKDLKLMDYELQSFFDGSLYKNRIWRGIVEGLPVYFIEPHHPGRFFWRECFYGCNDDFKRFTYFCRAALEFLLKSNKRPDVIHCHDWQTAAVAPLYKDVYVPLGLDSAQVAFTCHNFEYQGTENPGALASCGLNPQHLNDYARMRDNFMGDRINLLKGGVVFADVVTTVSPTYAQEVMGPEGGRGLHPTLKEHSLKFKGILNGIDDEAWNPMTDPMLEEQYHADDLEGKKANKRALKARLGLSSKGADEQRPLVGCVTRLVPQKGVHLIRHAIYRTVERGGQFVLLGSSPVPSIQADFEGIARNFQNSPHVRLVLKYDEGLSHLIYGGSDVFIIPSMFEPCGLTQLIAMRYGSIPVARRTGGLNDSVFDVDDGTIPDFQKNGFTFSATDEAGLNYALDRALQYFWERREWWQALVSKAMKMDFSWDVPVEKYLELYEDAVAKKRLQ